MTFKFVPRRCIWSVFVVLLVACRTSATEQPANQSTPTLQVPTITATSNLASASSTSTIFPATSSLSSSTPISSPPGGMQMAYIINGNLYLQIGNNPAIQLTNSGEDRQPLFSNDGKIILFLRGIIPTNLYAINVDDSQERVIISGHILSTLGTGYDELSEFRSFAFVPDTHSIIFNTRELDEGDVKMQDWNRTASKDKNDLLMADVDTGAIRVLLPPGRGGNFVISPDGSTIAVQTKGHIDLVSIDGQTIRRNLVTYTPTRPYELMPGVFWTVDSKELIVTLPVGLEYNMDGPETRSVWRYPVDGSANTMVSLNPPPLASDYSISPDGNWILYSYYYYPGKTNEKVAPGLYLGNLHQGTSQRYSQDVITATWSLDSKHFVYDGVFLGATQSSPKFIGNGSFLGWADATHYVYFSNKMIVIAEIDGQQTSFSVGIPESSISTWPYLFNYVFLDR